MPDPVIDEIREIRQRISAMCDHDPAKLVAYYRQLQAKYADRLITSPRFARASDAEGSVASGAGVTEDVATVPR